MIQTRFDEQACLKAWAKLDSYIDNELLTESNIELIQHFQRCPACTRETAERRKVRARLRTAIHDVPVPAGLEKRVRDRLREARQPRPARLHLMAIAAAIALCFASWLGYERGVLLSGPAISAILRIGLGDHIHCALPKQGTPAHVAVDKLPPEYKELIPIVQQHVPAEYPLVLAHECGFQGRKFVHLTFRAETGLLSLVITRKHEGESLGKGMHLENIKEFQVAGLESPDFLIYTVSRMSREKNRDVLTALAPSLQTILNQMGA